MWSQTKKRPTSVLRKAHGYPRPGLAPLNGQTDSTADGQEPGITGTNGLAEDEPAGPGSVGGDAASWISAVGVCKGTDLVVSTASLFVAVCSFPLGRVWLLQLRLTVLLQQCTCVVKDTLQSHDALSLTLSSVAV